MSVATALSAKNRFSIEQTGNWLATNLYAAIVAVQEKGRLNTLNQQGVNTMRGYKALIVEARKLMGKAGLLAYDRAKLLVEIASDPDFEPEVGGRAKAAEILNELCGDLAVKFVRLKQLFEHYPDRKQWAEGNLEKMLTAMYAASIKEEAEAAPNVKRKTATVSELEAAEAKVKHAEAHSKYVEEKLETAEEKIKRLESENAELRRQVAICEGRIKELERFANREPALA
ncbi:MAG: hypothetical protein KGL39_55225 [Patescibacteria group bacterium]|nr:hypothetical protein [Patescibacteria group bacterium]